MVYDMARYLFLSPHFDDAVGSCGGTIWRLASRGHPVRILTVFGGAEREPFSQPARILHDEWRLDRPVQSRRAEDARACQILGCASSFLAFPDAIYRQDSKGRHLYPTFDSLRGTLDREDGALAEQLCAHVAGTLGEEDTVYFCPMAIGGHVDHVVAKNCGHILSADGRAVIFYRDFYYDLSWEGECRGGLLTRVDIDLSGQELEKKVEAFSAYGSQIGELFDGQDGMYTYFRQFGSTESLFVPRKTAEQAIRILFSIFPAMGVPLGIAGAGDTA
jgi:LmbE family N-acetylglucosaminyl deacetylase